LSQYTIVDTLDTLLIMGLDEEYERARTWVQDELTFDVDVEFNAFEVGRSRSTGSSLASVHLLTPRPRLPMQITIRLLGGLLSAYHLSPFSDRTLYLAHAVDLGNRLLSTYQTPSGFPLSKVNLGRAVGIPDKDNRGLVSLAEVASTQLELKYLSEISGDDRYWKAAEHVMYAIRDQPSFDGLRPIFIEYVTPIRLPADEGLAADPTTTICPAPTPAALSRARSGSARAATATTST
jgi:hypothetical protein